MNLLRGPGQPCVGLAIAAAAGIIVADQWPSVAMAWLTVFAIAAIVSLAWGPSGSTYVLTGLAFFLLHSLNTTDTRGLRLAARLGEQPRIVAVTGTVVSEPKIFPNRFASFLFRLEAIELEGRTEQTHATIVVRWKGSPAFGDRLRLVGTAQPIGPPRNPGEFDFRSYMARQDVRRSFFVRDAKQGQTIEAAHASPLLRAAQKTRSWMEGVLARGIEDSPDLQALVAGVMLGINQQTPDDIEEPFRKTGTFHLFAVSGLNVAIIAQLLWMVGVFTRVPRRLLIALILPGLAFYAAVTGLHISCVRAAIMSAVLLCGAFVERRAIPVNSMGAAAIIILAWRTNELFSVGFQLSFAVVIAILLFSEPIFLWLRKFGATDPFLPRTLLSRTRRIFDTAAKWTWRSAAVSVAAWCASMPFILWNFYLVTPISVFANLIIVPIAFCILAIAMLSILAAPLLPWLSMIFNQANWLLAGLMLATVQMFAQIPGSHLYLGQLHWRPLTSITVLDVGRGGATHLHARRQEWLLDCGSRRDYHRSLLGYLHWAGINRLDGLMLTHGDAAHIGSAGLVLKDFRPISLIDNPASDRSSVHRRLRASLAQVRRPVTTPVAGEVVRVADGIEMKVLFPPRGFKASKGDDQALVVQLELASGARILFVSDSGVETEKTLLARGDLRSDILVKGQHVSGVSGSDEFLDAVQPKLIVATSRDFPHREHLSDEWVQKVRGRGTKLFRQDESGAVQLEFRSEGWTARAYLTGESFRSSSR